jgi:N-acylneuraminate cytidylyltransferase
MHFKGARDMKTVSVFFPLREGSSRVIKKNTRPISPDGRSLFELKLEQIAKLRDHFLEVIISTNDSAVISSFHHLFMAPTSG